MENNTRFSPPPPPRAVAAATISAYFVKYEEAMT